MSLVESGESNATVSLRALFEEVQPSSTAPDMTLDGLSHLVVRGGWPASLKTPTTRAQRLARSYVAEIKNDDLTRVDGKKRDSKKIGRLLHSLARNAEQATKTKTMIGDMTEVDSAVALARETIDDYLDALEKVFIIEEIGTWSPNLRSSIRINKRPKYHIVDPSLTAAILKTTASALVEDLETFGFLFECMCMRDLLTYGQADNAEVFYYRDREGLEADAIIQTEDGRWAAVEIKLGHNQADKAAASLLKVKEKIVAAGGKPPAFLAVVEGLGGFAYTREDGVYVIPICTLTV
jgi:predicted AAA+ superfamily ATPase